MYKLLICKLWYGETKITIAFGTQINAFYKTDAFALFGSKKP